MPQGLPCVLAPHTSQPYLLRPWPSFSAASWSAQHTSPSLLSYPLRACHTVSFQRSRCNQGNKRRVETGEGRGASGAPFGPVSRVSHRSEAFACSGLRETVVRRNLILASVLLVGLLRHRYVVPTFPGLQVARASKPHRRPTRNRVIPSRLSWVSIRSPLHRDTPTSARVRVLRRVGPARASCSEVSVRVVVDEKTIPFRDHHISVRWHPRTRDSHTGDSLGRAQQQCRVHEQSAQLIYSLAACGKNPTWL